MGLFYYYIFFKVLGKNTNIIVDIGVVIVVMVVIDVSVHIVISICAPVCGSYH